jgi:hypothetical protein
MEMYRAQAIAGADPDSAQGQSQPDLKATTPQGPSGSTEKEGNDGKLDEELPVESTLVRNLFIPSTIES